MNFYFHGMWRMDWGLGNPNKTAALIAMMMIAVWALVRWRRYGFWLALGLSTILGICLVHTASRGGLVAAFIGLSILGFIAPRPWPRRYVIGVIGSLWIIIASSVLMQAFPRYGEGLAEEDPSVSHRLEIWRNAPTMMVDAPAGWGLGRSGEAYMQWYQPVNRHEEYRTLVNSHLTWLVELGWPERVLYVLGWSFVLFLCFPPTRDLEKGIGLGIWTAFCCAAFFSSVAESIYLWFIPIISLGLVLRKRWISMDWPSIPSLGVPIGLSAVLVISLILIGNYSHKSTIRVSSIGVIIGSGNPKIWILTSSRTLGANYGRDWRRYSSSSCIGFVDSLQFIPSNAAGNLFICGDIDSTDRPLLGGIVARFDKVILVNPSFYPQDVKLEDPGKIITLFGEFSQSPSIDSWSKYLGRPVSLLAGVGDYIPKWPSRLMVSLKQGKGIGEGE